jgi:ATP-dependent helicase/nuclease subunit A
MGGMKMLTKEQQQVIDARGCNLLVSAGAGAGKTHTLVQRIIALIIGEDAIDVDRLLVVTFTNAAASEMRQRIGEAISKQLRKGNTSKHLRKQIRLLNKASISTIHSFCLEIIRQNFHRIDLDPNFRIADELESDLIKSDVVEALLERHYDKDDNADFLALVDNYGGQREDKLLQELILQIYNFAYSTPEPGKWLSNAAQMFYSPDIKTIDDYPWMAVIKDNIILELEKIKGLLVRALKISESQSGPMVYINNVKHELNKVDDLLLCCKGKWDLMEQEFNNWRFDRLSACRKKEVDEELKNKFNGLWKKAKDNSAQLVSKYFSKKQEIYLEDIKKTAPLMQKLIEIVLEFAIDYRETKKSKGLVDFTDLEHYALDILKSSPQIADEYKERFIYILVDEYQDINEVQEALLQCIARDKEDGANLLMVGDPKQSIYRFRLAEPSLFQSKQLNYSRDKNSKERRIDLSKNFRSRDTIINAVNFIFKQIMTQKIAEIDYDRDAELVYGANYPEDIHTVDRSIELILVDKKEMQYQNNLELNTDDDSMVRDLFTEDIEEELETSQMEARVIAGKIKELLSNKYPIYDNNLKSYRPIEYRDIVILLRATKGWANTILEEFRSLDIPSYADLSSGYFESVEVNTVISLLRVIDNPRQDIPLAAVLRSPMFNLNANELAKIKLTYSKGDFYDAVVKASKNSDSLGSKLLVFLSQLEMWRTLARRGNLSTLIWKIYKETGYFDYTGGLPGGDQRQANLKALYDRAKQYENLNFRGLSRFLNFLEAFLEKGKDLGEARSMGERENVVRVMSIHKSKGLEFPVVFVAGLGKKFNFLELNNNILLHKKMGLGPEFIDAKLRIKRPTMAKVAIRDKIKRENQAEEMRILYVALTRAKEKLFLLGTIKDIEKTTSKWVQTAYLDSWRLPNNILADAGTFLDWIGPCLIRHQDCAELLKYASEEPLKLKGNSEIANHPSSWKCSIIYETDLKKTSVTENNTFGHELNKIKNNQPLDTDGEYTEIVAQKLSWQYPHLASVRQSAVVSVTELKGLLHENDYGEQPIFPVLYTKKPSFLQETKSFTAVEYGNIMHTVMQHIDLVELRNNLNLNIILKKDLLVPEKVSSLQFFSYKNP